MLRDKAPSPIAIVLSLVVCLAALSISAYSLLFVYNTDQLNQWRLAPAPASDLPPLGINASLVDDDIPTQQRKLQLIRSAGLKWVRHPVPWREVEPSKGNYNWEKWDRLVDLARQYGLEVVAMLDRPPAWSRQDNNWDNRPPDAEEDFARFVYAFVSHFRDRVRYIQIWDEPNVFPNWGNRPVDPAGYVSLLRSAYDSARAADPRVTVLAAGLAPNNEAGGRNMSDLLYLSEMYRHDGGKYFDILAVKPYGLWFHPEDTRVDDSILNLSRVERHREISVQNGFADKPIWAVEWGWNSLPDDWKGPASVWGYVPADQQAALTRQAYQRAAKEWPWLQVLLLQGLAPELYQQHPLYGFSIVDWQLVPRPVYHTLRNLATSPTAAVGPHAAASAFVSYTGSWRTSGAELIGSPRDSFEIRFAGTRLDLHLRKTPDGGTLRITVDGVAASHSPDLSRDGTLDLFANEAQQVRVVAASGLADGEHVMRLDLSGHPGDSSAQPELAFGGFVVTREDNDPWPPAIGAAWLIWTAIFLGLAVWRMIQLIRLIRRFLLRLKARNERLTDIIGFATIALSLALVYFGSNPHAYAIGLFALAIAVYCHLEMGLLVVLLLTPTYMRPKSFEGFEFSLVEIVLVTCALAFGVKVISSFLYRAYAPEPGVPPSPGAHPPDDSLPSGNSASQIPDPFPWLAKTSLVEVGHGKGAIGSWRSNLPIILFLLAGLLSLSVSTVPRESLRELRTVLVEPIIYYYLLVSTLRSTRRAFDLANMLIIAGVAVSLVGIYQYMFTDDVITAEGVRRIKAFYGSPNNLGLFLGRAIPIALCLAWLANRNRGIYLGALSVMGVALLLTFSVGAWMAVLISALFIAAFAGRRAMAWTVAGATAGGLALVPILQVERISSHLSLEQGTSLFRVYIWQAALNMIRDNPLRGIGLDNFLYKYPQYMLPEAWREPLLSHPHNLILDFWLRLGSPGLVIIAWLLYGFFKAGARLCRRLGDGATRALAIGLMASMIDFIAHGLIDNSYFLIDLAIIWWAILATLRILSNEGDSA